MQLGQKVVSNRDFSGVPSGTHGVVDEIYDGGVMVAWDLPDRPLPENWQYEGQWAAQPGVPLRDGFSEGEYQFLDSVEEKCT